MPKIAHKLWPQPAVWESFYSGHAYHRVWVHPFCFAPASEHPQDAFYQKLSLVDTQR